MMKPTILAIFLLSLIGMSVTVLAENPANIGPEVIKFKMGDLTLPFKHWRHQKRIQGSKCFTCHTKEIGKILNWSKDTAHSLCIPCHELEKKGPIECKLCHFEIIGKKEGRSGIR